MLKSKYFWIAMVILVPFIVVWVMEGFGWAIATLGIVALFFLPALGVRSRRRRRYDYYDVYDDYGDDRDINININYGEDEERRPRERRIPPVVPINRKNAEWLAGNPSSSRRRQEKELNQILKRLRR